MVYFSIHSLLLLIQNYGWCKWRSKVDVLSRKAQVLSSPVLDLGQAWTEALLCFLQSQWAQHQHQEQKVEFQVSFWFLGCRNPTQTCCWDMLILASNSFPHRRLDRAQSCCVWGYLVAKILLCVCCCLNSRLNILWLRKCFSHWGGMPAVQQLMALPCSKGASCPLLFHLKTKSAKSIGFILVF